MTMRVTSLMATALVTASPLFAQTSNDPFPSPIPASNGVIRVDFVEFASIPDIDGAPARMMRLVDEPGTGRIFVNDMRGPLYAVSYDGRTVTEPRDRGRHPSRLRRIRPDPGRRWIARPHDAIGR